MPITIFNTDGYSTRARGMGDIGIWLAYPPEGYFLAYPETGSAYRHVFCGPNEDPHAMCPNCARPYLRYLLLDTNDPRLEMAHVPFRFMPLYYCWGCNGRIIWYRLRDDGSVGDRWHVRADPVEDHPYPGYPRAFPAAPATLIPLTTEQEDLLRRLNSDDLVIHYQRPYEFLIRPVHQVGGEPHFVQRFTDYEIQCPVCARPMPFLFNAGNDNLDPRGFAENDWVQTIFHICPDCLTIAAFTESD